MSARPCTGCFWMAQQIAGEARRWCGHEQFHGWVETGMLCAGAGYRLRAAPINGADIDPRQGEPRP